MDDLERRLREVPVLNCERCSTSTSFGLDAFRYNEKGERDVSGEVDYTAVVEEAVRLGWMLVEGKTVCMNKHSQ